LAEVLSSLFQYPFIYSSSYCHLNLISTETPFFWSPWCYRRVY
jgi:hypothetical protein